MKKQIIKYLIPFLYICIVGISIGARVYHIDGPVADWHSWRQADTAAVARNFLQFGIDPLHPRYDDLSNIQTGVDNPQGWRMVEMPIYQVVATYLYKFIPGISLEVSLRIVSIIATVGSVLLMGFLLTRLVSPFTGLVGAFIYAVLPFSIFYGRAILPGPFASFWALLSLSLLCKADSKRFWHVLTILAGVSAAIALLVRPMTAFLLLGSFYFLIKNGSNKQKILSFILYGLLSCIPLLLWRRWILQFPQGIAPSEWLYNYGDIRFKGAWFHWLFARRIAELILGYWGLIPFGIGMAVKSVKKEGWFSFLWISGGLLYLIIFARGNVQHDYYQTLLIPIIVWFSAKGFVALIQPAANFHRLSSIGLAATCMLFLWAFSWFTIRTFYWINRPEIVEAGKAAFLYQTHRQGWPIGFDIEKKIKQGAQYYVTVSPTDNDSETKELAKTYTILVRNDTYAIIDLTKPVKK
jgi:4-amino-4-deoxy-L-arabinose transferase-like glycosyltransferase